MAIGCETVRHQEVLLRPWKTRAGAAQNCMLCFFNKAVFQQGSKMVTMYQTLYKHFFFFFNHP